VTLGKIVRIIRGAVGNALVWGGAWFVSALGIFATLKLIGVAHGPWDGALRGAAMFAVMGTITGTAFSTYIGLRYRGRRLTEISWVRFGISGGILTGLFVPTFISIMRFLSGDPMLPLQALLFNGAVTAVLGGGAAGASMKLAQLGERRLSVGSRDEFGLPEGDRG
jgi:hypothetical protein